MSRIGKVCLILAVFSFLFVAIPRVFLEEWHHILFIPLIGFLVFLGVAIAKDFRFYLEFLTMKTTKHGANMGMLIVMALVLLVTVNYLGAHFMSQVKFDWTKERLNSLSEQTEKVLKNLDSDLEVKFFFGRGIQDVERVKEQFKGLVRLYTDKSKFVKVDFVDSIRQPDVAEEFKVDSGDSIIYLRYKGVRQRVDKFDEEGLTNAIVKLTHTKKRNAYFVTGHGERDIESKEPTGLYDFKQMLEGNQYVVKALKLFQENKVPADADVLLIVGPQQTLLEPELEAIRTYARGGGKMLIALDPGTHHNLAGLVKSFGVEFQNQFIIDTATNMPIMALGIDYSRTNELTKSFRPNNSMTLFYMASPLKKAPDAPAQLQIDEVVKTGPRTMLTADVPSKGVKVLPESEGVKTVVATVTGDYSKAHPPLSKDSKDAKKEEGGNHDFMAVIAGDSDFMSNQFLTQLLNRDLALNSVSYLARDSDMISIRPKQPTGTQLNLTRYQSLSLVLTYAMLPLLLALSGVGVFLKRRNA